MKKIIYFTVSKGEHYYFAECTDLAIVTQGKTLDDTVKNIKEAFCLHIEGENLNDLDISSSPAISINYDLGELVYA